MSAEAARHTIAVVRASQDALAALAAPLSAEQLRQRSFAKDWTIAQVLSHLGSQAEIMDATFSAIVAGEEPPGQDTMPAVWDRWNAMTPEEQRDGCLASNEQAVAHMEALDDDQLEHLHLVLFGGVFEVDVEGFAHLRLSEHSMHSWDVAVALDPTARIPQATVDIVLAFAPALIARVGKPQPVPIRVRIDLTDPTQSLALVAEDDAVALEPWADQDVTGTVRTSSEAFLRLLYGRVAERDQIDIDAPDVTLADLQALFPGF
jgi:uncharacterized protein (TIGR03083 family)